MTQIFDSITNYIEETMELSFDELDEESAKDYAIGHIDCFLTWLIRHDYTMYEDSLIREIKSGQMTANSFLLSHGNGQLESTYIKEEVRTFVEEYYPTYQEQYRKTVATILKKLPLEFVLTIEDYQKISYIIEEAYEIYGQKNHNQVEKVDSVGEGITYFQNQEYEKAFELLRDQKEERAFATLGLMYLRGFGVEKDKKLAKEYLDKSIEEDNIFNLMTYAELCHTKEISTGPSGPTHLSLYQRASELGHLEATLLLADHYSKADYNSVAGKGIEYYLKAAREGNSYAQGKAGICYLEQIGVPCNYKRALKWLQIAYDQQEESALVPLAKCYEFGLGVAENREKAIALYESAYEEYHNEEAAYALGKWYLEKGDSKGIALIKQACDTNMKEAITLYGIFLWEGTYITQNREQALTYFEQASELGELEALYRRGECYELGILYEHNWKLAFQMYQKAAGGKHAKALRKMGYCYEMGLGTNKSSAKAKNYYESAVELGDEQARIDLEFLILSNPLNRETKDRIKEAHSYIEEDNNHVHIQYRLGLCYKEGVGYEEDLEKAITHLTRSAKENYKNSRELLKEVKLKQLS